MSARLQAQFEKFHRDNPHVYDLVDKYVREVLAAGFQHYSMSSIIERVRWHATIETKRDDDFKIANAHRAYYARHWMKMNPDHKGFFHLAELRSEGVEQAEQLKQTKLADQRAERARKRQEIHDRMRLEM